MPETEAAAAPVADPASTSTLSSTPPPAPASEAKPSEGEKKLLAGKYKTTEDLEKGYTELNKKLGEKFNPPEKYDLDFSTDPDFKDKVFPPSFAAAAEKYDKIFRDLKIPQGAAKALAKEYMNDLLSTYTHVDPEAEKEKLGTDRDTILSTLESYSNKLDEKQRETFKALAYDAESTKLVYNLVRGLGEKPITGKDANVESSAQAETHQSLIEWKKAHPNWDSNSVLRAEYAEKLINLK